ncbi:MAG: DUF1934 domain-containing protein [Blautia sp.]|nr:DUF1934 domain-containing protein [Blautia sp.]
MEKDVLIHVRGLQMTEAEGEEEPVEIIVPGEYYYRNGSHYLRYEEMVDDTAEPTVNYVKISDKGMEVRKKGLINVHMVFEQGKKNLTYYKTPFGAIQMGIAATGMELFAGEQELHTTVDYALEINGAHVADCTLSILAHSRSYGEFQL